MDEELKNMTLVQIAEMAKAMLQDIDIPNRNFATIGTTIVGTIDGNQFSNHFDICRFGDNHVVKNQQDGSNTVVKNLTDVVNVIKKAM